MTVIPMPDLDSVRGRVAGEVRAEMSRARVRVSHLPRALGKSHMYWSRRVNGETALDVEDLVGLAGLLGVSVTDFFRVLDSRPGPGGPDGGQWAPSGSNRRPTDYKLGERAGAAVLSFPLSRAA